MTSMFPRWPLIVLAITPLCVSSGCALLPSNKPVVSDVSMAERRLSLARLSERRGNVREAQLMYQVLAEEDPQNQAVQHRLAVIAARQQRFDQATQHFHNAEQLGPASAELLSDHGFMMYLQNDFPAAEQKLHAALQLDPSCKSAHNNLAMVLGYQQRYDECLTHFRNSVSEAEALANLAYIQTRVGDLEAAESNYHRALEYDRSLRPAAEALVQVASRTSGRQFPDVPTASLVQWEAVDDEPERHVKTAGVEHHLESLPQN